MDSELSTCGVMVAKLGQLADQIRINVYWRCEKSRNSFFQKSQNNKSIKMGNKANRGTQFISYNFR